MNACALIPRTTEEDDLIVFLENTLRRVQGLNISYRDAAAAMRAGARLLDLARVNPNMSEREMAKAVLANLRGELRLARMPQRARVH